MFKFFITKICSKYKHINRFYISNMILEMHEIVESNKSSNSKEDVFIDNENFYKYEAFWNYERNYHDYVSSLDKFYSFVKVLTSYELSLMFSVAVTNPALAIGYSNAVNQRIPVLEQIIAKSSYYSYKYALYVIKEPFSLGESAIATNAEDSYYYAKHVLRARFPLGESVIMNDPYYSYWYTDIIKDRDLN